MATFLSRCRAAIAVVAVAACSDPIDPAPLQSEPPGEEYENSQYPDTGPNDEPPPVVKADCAICAGASCDFDADLLTDDEELKLGTNPCSPDTDADGLPDDLEVKGFTHPAPFGFIDYPKVYGTDPKVKDLLVEVDYHQYKDAKDKSHSARLSDAVVSHLKTYYASLQIPYPDGSKGGIHLVVVHDDTHPLGPANGVIDPPGTNASHDCYVGKDDASGDKSSSDFPDTTFRKASLCLGSSARGNGTSRVLKIIAPETNNLVDGVQDDETETAQHTWYWMFLHEMGHSLGLLHGGNENLNYKPNYPSVMNYRYDANLGDHAKTLKATRVGYSTGKLRNFPLNPCVLDERNSFTGLTEADVKFLATGNSDATSLTRAYRVSAGSTGPEVDWNGNGSTDTALVASVVTSPAIACTGKTPGSAIRDVDDLAIIAKCMHGGLPATKLAIDKACP